jgi:hypothetical protein
MKKLLLAFAFIGFMVTSYATASVSTSTVMMECEDKCDKKDCKHDTKACADFKKSCSKDKKKCKKSSAKKACCSKKDGKKSCSKDKKATEKK